MEGTVRFKQALFFTPAIKAVILIILPAPTFAWLAYTRTWQLIQTTVKMELICISLDTLPEMRQGV
jgi:hypothetical protein